MQEADSVGFTHSSATVTHPQNSPSRGIQGSPMQLKLRAHRDFAGTIHFVLRRRWPPGAIALLVES